MEYLKQANNGLLQAVEVSKSETDTSYIKQCLLAIFYMQEKQLQF
jgi:hypothetical protein